MIADSHTTEIQPKKSSLNIDYPKTELIFYDNFKKSVFDGKIIGVEKINNEIYLILDKTAFYPEGGGQPSDIGKIVIDNIEFEVVHVEKINEIVLHKISTDLDVDFFISKVNSNVGCIIDWSRRIALARNHTATHLIIAAAKKVLGNHIWQTGAQKGLKHSRIDLSHYKRISQSEINEIEKIANEYVMENLEVDTRFMSRNDAESAYGLTLYQGGVVPGSVIRVVKICGSEIENESSDKQGIFSSYVDVQACGGTHILQTGDIGLIKINKTERVQDGVERIDFSAGISAISSMQENDTYLRESSDIFKVTPDLLPKTSDRFFKEWKSFKNEIKKLNSEIAKTKIKDLENNITKYRELNLLSDILEANVKELQKIATDLTDESKVDIVILANNNGKILVSSSEIAIEKGFGADDIMQKLAIELGGGGGGRKTLAQGSVSNISKIKKIFDSLNEILESFL